jgi:hypothetical protein
MQQGEKMRTRVAAISISLLLLTAASGAAEDASSDTESRLRELENRIEELEQQIRSGGQGVEETGSAATPSEPPPLESGSAPPAGADLAELERRIEILTAEIERMRLGEAAVVAGEGQYGLGPAASKIYATTDGLSIGGYGEMLYERPEDETDAELDFLRAVFYFGYKFSDRWLFNSEIELEHASTGEGGSASVEFAYIDYLRSSSLNARFGMVLVPMGFVNELHEPPVFLGARRPDVEQVLIPSTWRENGLGLFGDIGPFAYRTYIVNGLDASGFSAQGLRGGRQKGARAKADDLAWVGRFDYVGRPGLLAGVALYRGGSGQGLDGPDGGTIDATTTIWEAHLEWKRRGLEVRALAAGAQVDDAAQLNQALGLEGRSSVGERLEGWYVQVGYDLESSIGPLEHSLIPYLRREAFDTQAAVPAGYLADPANDVESWTVGIAYKPIDQVVFKLDFQDYDNGAGTAVDQMNVAVGYLF